MVLRTAAQQARVRTVARRARPGAAARDACRGDAAPESPRHAADREPPAAGVLPAAAPPADTTPSGTAPSGTAPAAPAGNAPGARWVRAAVAGLWHDLVVDAFAVRPLPPLAEFPVPARVRRRLPAAVGRALRWTPHAALLVAVALLVRLQSQAQVGAGERASGGALVAGAFLFTLCWPVLAAWLLLAAGAVSTFHPRRLVGPFPFADLSRWPDLLRDASGRPWAMAGFLACTGVMAILAVRLPLRALAWLWVLTVAVAAVGNGPFSMGTLVMALYSGLLPLTGLVVDGRREARAAAAARAVHAAAAEHERARRRVLEERAVIARELHDVVAHHMSVIAIQAEAAPYRVPEPPPELERAFGTVRESAVAALTELRRVLGVITAEPQSAEPDPPQPVLADLDALLAGVRATGQRVTTEVTGPARTLPRGVELSAYRIVQEALSNALRHAPDAPVRVELRYLPSGLGLTVANGPPARPAGPSPGAGRGLTGMRERVTMLGGRLTAAGTGDGGFEVVAFLPSACRPEDGPGAADGPSAAGGPDAADAPGEYHAPRQTPDRQATGGGDRETTDDRDRKTARGQDRDTAGGPGPGTTGEATDG